MYLFDMTTKPLTTADLYAMLDKRRVELGLSQLQLGQLALGRPDVSVIQNLKRGSSPTFDRLAQICDALGFELYCGPPRDGPENRRATLAEDAPATDLSAPTAIRAGFLPLPWHRLAKSQGVSPLALRENFLAQLGKQPDSLSAVAPDECHIPHEADLRTCIAVIDSAANSGPAPEVWALLERGKMVIARIQSRKEALLIHDADPAVGVRLVAGAEREAIAKLGRVIWMGQPMARETVRREVMS